MLIARALMGRPRLLILDEPCAGLDPVARENFLRLIPVLVDKRRDRARRPVEALIFVTHHVEEITPLFTHALLLREGGVVAAGPCRSRAHVTESQRDFWYADEIGSFA